MGWGLVLEGGTILKQAPFWVPWVPEAFYTRFLASVKSLFVKSLSLAVTAFGRRSEASSGHEKKPLLPRVLFGG